MNYKIRGDYIFKRLKKLLILFLLITTLIPTINVYAATSKTTYVTEKTYLGKFKITYYCPCSKCSGKWGRKTSTGKLAKEGRTIAVDSKVIPYGSKIKIGSKTYVAEDCGGAIKGKRIDVFIESHKKCIKNGVKYKK